MYTFGIMNSRSDSKGVPTMPKKHMGTTYYTVTELANMMGVHRNTVILWINQGYIKATRIGMAPKSPWIIPLSEVKRIQARA
jgi:excisionase family DNA binding protein